MILESRNACIILMCYKKQLRTHKRWQRQMPKHIRVAIKKCW